ncbi:gamma-glutamyltransferase [Allostreptomyces psammosilenae]|uniref:Glutathione hydrolase proenzyme n=1 Tax=Allostreptomyces psammosilenae TaxID=1892865 RepID=A0A853A295_9ACTN|nr:gamma-glutamyltransferase [Allostreptomyces psammosilenae]NYI04891.1 gamma-glutamyltranspeptidase/glutathione hydrolase [Allostreptomyces psammosilenae]
MTGPLRRRTFLTSTGALGAGAVIGAGAPAARASAPPAPGATTTRTTPVAAPGAGTVAVGEAGVVATVDADATRIAVELLAAGRNAVDAAVAAAAALGVTEPYSCGLGGGGYFVFLEGRTGRVRTLDGRETAPARMRRDSFLDPATGRPVPFAEAVTSGLSVGVPGTLLTWATALELWGSLSLARALEPAARLAEEGFVVDATFRQQTADNEARFRRFPDTVELFLPGGRLPEVGSRMYNPDLAATYRTIARRGVGWLYGGRLGTEVARTAARPPVAPGDSVRPGLLADGDLARYRVLRRDPTRIRYRGREVYGMASSSSGGSTVGEALNILERFDLAAADEVTARHLYLEACRLAFADRNRWVGDPEFVEVPREELLSDEYAAERACLISPDRALTSPVAPGDPTDDLSACPPAGVGAAGEPYEGRSTTHLVVADRWGNVVAYNLTIEQTGGSGITVPGRGFILNNELTDFSFAPLFEGVPDPNLPAPGKRPRSSMAPTIVTERGRPLLACGTPGGATIITTVLQLLTDRLDRGLSLPDAMAAPRWSQRNNATTQGEPEALASPVAEGLTALGHSFAATPEIGAASALEFLGDGRGVMAVAEPRRRGGGAAGAA